MIAKIQKLFFLFFVFIAMGITKSQADDWDNFYNKFGSKAFVVNWKDKWIDSDGKLTDDWDHEFGFSMTSPNVIRQFTRNTDL